MKLLEAYNPDMAYPLIDGKEYPYSILEAFKYFESIGSRCMGPYDYSQYLHEVNREKEQRLTRYNFLP